MSARNVPEFEFNLNLARRIEERLKADGFAETYLMITEGKARPSLARRVAVANKRGADLFLSIHHDSVPDIYNESWEFEGKRRHFNDLFAGYSVFVSQQNPHYRESLRFAKLVGNEMASQDLVFARQYDQWFMGKYQRELLDHDAGVYRYDQLIVLKSTRMPAVLLESGSIINREEEVKMASEEHKDKVATAVLGAVAEYCDTRGAAPPQISQPQPKPAQAKPRTAQPQPKPSRKPRRARRPASADSSYSGIFRNSRLARPASSRSRSRSIRRRVSSVILPSRSSVWMQLRSTPDQLAGQLDAQRRRLMLVGRVG